MQKIFFFLIITFPAIGLNGQIDSRDTNYNYATRISSVEWMPDGKDILLGIVKHHKTDHQAPFFSKVVLYNIQSRQFKHLFDDGSNLTVSPNGKTIAFLKRSEKIRTDIYFYSISTKQQTVLKTDTLRKYGLNWSSDGKNLVYNVSASKKNASSSVSIYVLNLVTKKTRQITKNDGHKSYNPAWSPDNKHIVYYLEKGDGHDQIWLTDINGSFHKNLTNDTSTHNYFPSWLDNKTVIYTQSPSILMMMSVDGSGKQEIAGVNSTPVKYNAKTTQLAYIKSEEENKLILFDWKKKTASAMLDGTKLMKQF